MRLVPYGEYFKRVSEFKTNLGFVGNFRNYAIDCKQKEKKKSNYKCQLIICVSVMALSSIYVSI